MTPNNPEAYQAKARRERKEFRKAEFQRAIDNGSMKIRYMNKDERKRGKVRLRSKPKRNVGER